MMVLISLIFEQDVVLAVLQLKVGVVVSPLQRLSILPISEVTLDLNSCYAVKVSLSHVGLEGQLPDLEDRRLNLLSGTLMA